MPASLSSLIRALARQQHQSLIAAAKAGRDDYLAQAVKAKNVGDKQRFKAMAKHAMDEGTATANRLRMSADNAADSYARTMRRLADDAQAEAAKLTAKAKGKSTARETTKKTAAKPKATKAKAAKS